MSAIRQVNSIHILCLIFPDDNCSFDNFCAQSLGEIPMVEDELRKAAGTEENVDESLAAGPTQQVIYWKYTCQANSVVFNDLCPFRSW